MAHLPLILGGCALLAGGAAGGVVPPWIAAGAAGAGLGIWLGARGRDPRRDFVTAVSHELRTPVAQIRLLSESLLLGAGNEEERTRWLGAIAREAQTLDDRIASVLLYAHDDGLAAGITAQRVDIGVLVEDVAAGYADAAETRDMRIAAEAEEGLVVDGDPQTLRLALVNLIENACRFGPVGQTVRLTARREDDQVRVTVRDDGPGIPESERERVWAPFARGDAGGGTAGHGLGLTVVRRIAAGHGGTASVDETVQGGAAVSLRLPLAS